MAYIVYLTDKCKKELEKHNVQESINTIIERIEKEGYPQLFDPFPVPYYVKKKIGAYQMRLIAREYKCGEHKVLALLACLVRGDQKYNDFQKDPTRYGSDHLESRVNIEEMNKYVAGKVDQGPVGRPALSEEEQLYLFDPVIWQHHGIMGECLYFETPNWVHKIATDHYGPLLPRVFDTLVKNRLEDKEHGRYCEPLVNRTEIRLCFSVFPEYNALLLEDIILPDDPAPAAPSPPDITEREDLYRQAARVWPYYLLADETLWVNLEKNTKGNYALSTEESKVLESTWGKEPFPLFIRGRAGSGKSTILQYIFTDYFVRSLKYPHLGQPLYFACNDELLRQAREMIGSLIRYNPLLEHLPAKEKFKGKTKEGNQLLEKSCNNFRTFLRNLIPPQERNQLFAENNYIGFAEFTAMWNSRFSNAKNKASKEKGPDICWHVIRTFIKGMSVDEYLEPEDYETIDKAQHTVTDTVYRDIYDEVWKKWYWEECKSFKYWDDQDLARYVLEHGLVEGNYPGIFCDEAQDFTRIELEIILQLNRFSHRALDTNSIYRVPFAFAGDEMQTLNPTGFRWESIKGWFTEKFIHSLLPQMQNSSPRLNYHVLNNNYRSMMQVTKFSNYLQLLRSIRFSNKDIQPQQSWTGKKGAQVTFFKNNDPEFWKSINQRKSEVVIIVPCLDKENIAYLRKDPVLSAHIKLEENNRTAITILGPVMAKGLEYPVVIVYGFGKECKSDIAADLERIIANEKIDFNDSDRMSLEYYFNRLYVAVSRPRNQLIIVDEPEGLKKMWQVMQNAELRKKIVTHVSGNGIWDGSIAGLHDGKPEHLNFEKTASIEETAGQLENSGQRIRDPYQLRQAASLFEDAGHTNRARHCEALACELENSYMRAAELYRDNQEYESALRCCWFHGRDARDTLLEIASHATALENSPVVLMTKVLVHRDHALAAIVLAELIAAIRNDHLEQYYPARMQLWKQAVDECLEMILEKKQLTRQLYDHVLSLSMTMLGLNQATLGHAAYHCQEYSRAVELWEKSGHTATPEYWRARSLCTTYPDCLQYHARLKEWDIIIRKYQESEERTQGAEQRDSIRIEKKPVLLSNRNRAYVYEAYNNHYGKSDQPFSDKELEQRYNADIAFLLSNTSELTPTECEPFVWHRSELELYGAIRRMLNEDNSQPIIALLNDEKKSEKTDEYRTVMLIRFLAWIDIEKRSITDAEPFANSARKFLQRYLNNRKVPRDYLVETGLALENFGETADVMDYYRYIASKGGNVADRISIVLARVLEENSRKVKPMSLAALTRMYPELEQQNHEALAKTEIRKRFRGERETLTREIFMKGRIRYLYLPGYDPSQEIRSQGSMPSAPVPVESRVPVIILETGAVEYDGYRFSYFSRSDRLNIESSQSGEVISLKNRSAEPDRGFEQASSPDADGFVSVPVMELAIKPAADGHPLTVKFGASGRFLQVILPDS